MSKGKSTGAAGPRTVKRKIEEWLRAENFAIAEPPPREAHWVLQIEMMGGRKIFIALPIDSPQKVVFQGPVTVSPVHAEAYMAMDPKERKALAWELVFRLLETGCDFGINEPIEQVHLARSVYVEAMDRQRFFDELGALTRAITIVQYVFSKACEEAPPTSSPGTVQ